MIADNPLIRITKGKYREGAIVFVHGFAGDRAETWRMFPTLLADNLKSFDVYSFGYATGIGLDLVGLWSADPDIPKVAKLFSTTIIYSLARYKTIAVIAH